MRWLGTAALAIAACLGGCDRADGCTENLGAQVLAARVLVKVAGVELMAELADEAVERERGWRKRACDREAILLVPDAPEPVPVWGCELVAPVTVVSLQGEVAAGVGVLEPCPAPCDACPQLGQGVWVDAVLEVPAGVLDVGVGDAVRWRE